MYVRFVCARPHPTLNAELGMFAAKYDLDVSQLPGSLQRAHDEAWFWFRANGGGGLRYPRLRGKARTTKVRKSLFWFRRDARFFGYPTGSVVRRARELAHVITEAGTEIRELRSNDPGEIIWQDVDQVLAYAGDRQIPRAF